MREARPKHRPPELDPDKFRPLTITATLLDGRVCSADLTLPLDGILTAGWMRQYHPVMLGYARSGLPPSEQTDIPLPIKRVGEGGDWHYAASYAFGEPRSSARLEYVHKRFRQHEAEDYMQEKKGAVNVQSGKYKAYRIPLSVYVMAGRTLTWHAIGHKMEVLKCLWGIKGVGKKIDIGYGKVAKTRRPLRVAWRVEFDNRGSHYKGKPLAAARAIPDEAGEDYFAIRPPYFDPSTLRAVRWPEWAEGLACNHVREGRYALTG